MKKEIIYWKFAGKPPTTNTVLGALKGNFLVLKGCCTDPWWKKLIRKMGFYMLNREGLTKVTPYKPKR